MHLRDGSASSLGAPCPARLGPFGSPPLGPHCAFLMPVFSLPASQQPGGCSHPREALPPQVQQLPPLPRLPVRDVHGADTGPPDLPADRQGQGRYRPSRQDQPAGLRPQTALLARQPPPAARPLGWATPPETTGTAFRPRPRGLNAALLGRDRLGGMN